MKNDKQVRYGVIGLHRGKHHLRCARKNARAKIAAVIDINEDLAREFGKKLGVPTFTDYREALDAKLVDAVSIATPHHTLADIATGCLKAGVHVFLEKPFAIRISEANEILRLARNNGLKVCAGYHKRQFRTPQTLKRLIENDDIGDIQSVLWTWGVFRPESYFSRNPWVTSWGQAGGGILVVHCAHELDLLCWLFGQPRQVAAVIRNQMHSADTEDTVCASVEFENGALASLQFTINHPPAYSVRHIAGDKGIVVLPNVHSLIKDDLDEIRLGLYDGKLSTLNDSLRGCHDQPMLRWQTIQKAGAGVDISKLMRPRRLWRKLGLLDKPSDPLATLLDSFVDSILDGGEPMVTGDEARRTVELINAIVLSSMRKKLVQFPIDTDEYDTLFAELKSGAVSVPGRPASETPRLR